MVKPTLRCVDIAAVIVTVIAALAQITGCALPDWWTYESSTGETFIIGIVKSTGCDQFNRCDESLITIDGGKEWLFMTRIFELFGAILCLVAGCVHMIFLPTRNYNIRAISIYVTGAAALFILSGAVIFVVMYSDLEGVVNTELGTAGLGPIGLSLCFLSGVLSVVSTVITTYATVKKGDDYYAKYEIV